MNSRPPFICNQFGFESIRCKSDENEKGTIIHGASEKLDSLTLMLSGGYPNGNIKAVPRLICLIATNDYCCPYD